MSQRTGRRLASAQAETPGQNASGLTCAKTTPRATDRPLAQPGPSSAARRNAHDPRETGKAQTQPNLSTKGTPVTRLGALTRVANSDSATQYYKQVQPGAIQT